MLNYPWFQTCWQDWCEVVNHDRLASATLLTMPHGMGESHLIEQMVQSLLCTHGVDRCGFCHACQLLESNSHPDLHWISPEQAGKMITVAQIRQASHVAYASSQLGGARVMVISPAEQMNEAASNALLKTLEEPPARCFFILSASQRAQLLPTIVSRCRQISVASPSLAVASQWLTEQLGDPVPDYVLGLNEGAPIRALTFMQTNQLETYQLLEQKFSAFLQSPATEIQHFTQWLKADPTTKLRWLWYLLVAAQKAHFQIHSSSQLPMSQEISEQVSYDTLYTQSQRLMALLEQYRAFSGLNIELLIFNWLSLF